MQPACYNSFVFLYVRQLFCLNLVSNMKKIFNKLRTRSSLRSLPGKTNCDISQVINMYWMISLDTFSKSLDHIDARCLFIIIKSRMKMIDVDLMLIDSRVQRQQQNFNEQRALSFQVEVNVYLSFLLLSSFPHCLNDINGTASSKRMHTCKLLIHLK